MSRTDKAYGCELLDFFKRCLLVVHTRNKSVGQNLAVENNDKVPGDKSARAGLQKRGFIGSVARCGQGEKTGQDFFRISEILNMLLWKPLLKRCPKQSPAKGIPKTGSVSVHLHAGN